MELTLRGIAAVQRERIISFQMHFNSQVINRWMMNSNNYLVDCVVWTLLIIFACLRSYNCLRTSTYWKMDGPLNNFVCPTEASYVTRESSIITCGRLCTVRDSCVSFIYNPTTAITDDNCYLNDYELNSSNGCLPINNAKYFKEIKQTFSCHPDDGIYRTVQLSDGDAFTYRVVHTELSMANAQSECESSGGNLAKLSSISRLKLIYELMTTCPGFGGANMYYVDGSDSNSDNVYKWSDGNIIPMTADFWRPGMPNGQYEHCLIVLNTEWLHDDIGCSVAKNYICERQ
ncbi:hypothetical protein ACF0H5_020628 [Mactra antiquata]